MYMPYAMVNGRRIFAKTPEKCLEFIRKIILQWIEPFFFAFSGGQDMPIYKIKYIKECEHIMEVEADSKEDA